ncbi:MAG TPA: serine/threonine-protein kinase [Kofleriaceae bacterium]|nr:serine/threonine-protein kinase [Kofleriaceae bacterium]
MDGGPETGSGSSTIEHTIERTIDRTNAPGAAGHDELLPRGTAIRRYVVLERLGEGGMGVVYAAYDYGLDRRIALKLVRDHAGAAARARLMREGQALAKLSHPNVVAVYDIGEHAEEVFIAMELVDGGSLRDWLEAEPRDWRAIVEVFRRAGEGLAAAHGAGIVHRDVKPDNILIDRSGAVRVGDFGLAIVAYGADEVREGAAPAVASAVTVSGLALGTPAYMAPEQHRGRRDVDARTDQFGFCVALYEALYGVRPFAGSSASELCAATESGRFAPIASGREVPAWIRRAVTRGLAADPAARFPSMAAVLAELGRDPRARRRRWLLAGAALAVVAGVALASAKLAGGEAVAACRTDDARFAGVWDEPRRAAIQAAFAHSGAPDAGDAWQRVERALDERTAGWQRMRVEACEATHVRAEQSAELLDRRMACLDDRAAEVRALSDVLAVADRAAVNRAAAAAHGLEPIEACSRGAALRAGGHRASDAGAVERRARLSQAEAVGLVGGRLRALELLRPLVTDAHAAHDRELEGKAQRLYGELLVERGEKGDLDAAEEAYQGAIRAATADGADELAARAWLDLAWLTGEERGQHAQAHQLAAVAQAVIDRLGSAPALEAKLEDRVGVLFYDQGKYGEAATHLERGLALREQLFGAGSVEAAASLQHVAILRTAEGKKELALELHRRARENAERARGPNSHEVIAYLGGEGAALYELGRSDEALALFERALAAVLRNDPDDARNAAGLISNISVIQRERGQLAAAQATVERAIAMFERVGGPDNPLLVEPLCNLALLFQDRARYDEAAARLARALAIQERALGKEHPELGSTLSQIGSLHSAAKRPALAIAPLERAIALREPLPAAAQAVAEDRFKLARALVAARGERARAGALADQARATFVAGGDAASAEGVDRWRAEVGLRGTPGRR